MASHHRSSTFVLAELACAASLAVTSVPAQAIDNLVTNGSFQFSNIGPTGWTFLRPGGEFWNSFGFQVSPDGGSYFGIQDLHDFTSRFNVIGITQNIAGLQPGRQYELSFYSMSNHTQQSPTARQQWRVSFGGETGFSGQTFASPTPSWIQSHLTFTATAAVLLPSILLRSPGVSAVTRPENTTSDCCVSPCIVSHRHAEIDEARTGMTASRTIAAARIDFHIPRSYLDSQVVSGAAAA